MEVQHLVEQCSYKGSVVLLIKGTHAAWETEEVAVDSQVEPNEQAHLKKSWNYNHYRLQSHL